MLLIEARRPSLAILLTLLTDTILCVPELAFPINSQVPPVAYASIPYSFEFSATTFISSAPQISYTLSDGPGWLNIDSLNRRFSGTPHSNDLGSSIFLLTASDIEGDTSITVTLVVLESVKIKITEPIVAQLAHAGPTSSPKSLLLRPLEPFNLAFDNSFFAGTNINTKYYAVSADSSPLPSWLQFDAVQLRFSGVSPSLVSPSALAQVYGIHLVASNVPGFAEAVAEFEFIVEYHILAFSTSFQVITISAGKRLQTPPLRNALMLDGHPISDDQIASITVDGPPWVQLDTNQISISGQPDTHTHTAITITVADIFGNIANTTWSLQFSDLLSLQLGVIAEVNATIGAFFFYTLNMSTSYVASKIEISRWDVPDWLNYNATNLTFYGEVPQQLSPATIKISILLLNATTDATGNLAIQLIMGHESTAATSILQGTTASHHPSSTGKSPATSATTANRQVAKDNWNLTILAICLSVVGALLVSLICVILWWRQRRRREHEESSVSVTSTSLAGRTPAFDIVPEQPQQTSSVLNPEHVTRVESNFPVRPPRIDLTWSSDSLQRAGFRLSGTKPARSHRSSKLVAARRISANPGEVQALPEWLPSLPQDSPSALPANSLGAGNRTSNNRPLRSSIYNSGSGQAVGLPDRRSGAGHGSGILGQEEAGVSRTWRNTLTSNTTSETRRSTIALDSFPIPPAERSNKRKDEVAMRSATPNLSAVFDAIEESLSFEAQRQRWHTERARARLEGTARFSNRGSSRIIASQRYFAPEGSDLRNTMAQETPARNRVEHASPLRMPKDCSWSEWSGIGPATHDLAEVERPFGSVQANTTCRKRGDSIASSRQFDSVASSDSQWEDGDPSRVEDGTSVGQPRLPFSPLTHSQENMRDSRTTMSTRQGRIADKRNLVNVEQSGLKRNQNSQKGSLRYI